MFFGRDLAVIKKQYPLVCVCVCIKCVCFPLCKYPMYCGARSTLQKPPLLQALVVSGLPQRSCFGGATGSPEPPVWGDVGTCLTHIYRTVYIYIYYLTRNKKTGSFTDALELFEVLWFYNALYIYISDNRIRVHWDPLSLFQHKYFCNKSTSTSALYTVRSF